MTLTIKEQIDGLLAYAEYQEAQSQGALRAPPQCASEWIRIRLLMNAIRARREARILREQNNA
jgi:hypothetical protein